MKLQDQVCTLEQAKRLGELGVIQARSLFFYDTEEKIVYNPWLSSGGYQYPEYCFSAFTVAELGKALPDLITTDKQYEWVSLNEGNCWVAAYFRGNDLKDQLFKQVGGETEAKARASLLIHLLENNLTTPEECNQRIIN